MRLTDRELGVNIRPKGAINDPNISTQGMNIVVNIVNTVEPTPIFPLQAHITTPSD